jgi:hypothetical protein
MIEEIQSPPSEATSTKTIIRWVLADAEFDRKGNYTYVREKLRAQNVISAKRCKKTRPLRRVHAEIRGSIRGGSTTTISD